MGTAKTCDVCRMARQALDRETMEPVLAVHRYTLRRDMKAKPVNGERRARRYQISAGGIDLCDDCWTRLCKPNANPNKARGHMRWTKTGDAAP